MEKLIKTFRAAGVYLLHLLAAIVLLAITVVFVLLPLLIRNPDMVVGIVLDAIQKSPSWPRNQPK